MYSEGDVKTEVCWRGGAEGQKVSNTPKKKDDAGLDVHIQTEGG